MEIKYINFLCYIQAWLVFCLQQRGIVKYFDSVFHNFFSTLGILVFVQVNSLQTEQSSLIIWVWKQTLELLEQCVLNAETVV